MSEEQPMAVDTESDPAPEPEHEGPDHGHDDAPAPGWWHRSHPTFASLTGFYGGMLFIILVPGLWGGITAWLFGQSRAESLFAWVLVTLVVPAALLVPRKTRRFAIYLWIGIVTTAIVVVGVAALVLWLLIHHG
jgi:hypothetical protein